MSKITYCGLSAARRFQKFRKQSQARIHVQQRRSTVSFNLSARFPRLIMFRSLSPLLRWLSFFPNHESASCFVSFFPDIYPLFLLFPSPFFLFSFSFLSLSLSFPCPCPFLFPFFFFPFPPRFPFPSLPFECKDAADPIPLLPNEDGGFAIDISLKSPRTMEKKEKEGEGRGKRRQEHQWYKARLWSTVCPGPRKPAGPR